MSILGIMTISVVFGIKKGFFFSLFSFFAILSGFLIAWYFTGLLAPFFGASRVGKGSVFIVFLILSVGGLYITARFVLMISQVFLSGATDRLLGVAVGLLRGLVMCCILLFFTLLLDAARFEPVRNSRIAPRIMRSMKTLAGKAPAGISGQLVKITPDR